MTYVPLRKITPQERLAMVIRGLRGLEGMPIPYTYTTEDADELGYLIDELDLVYEELGGEG